MLFKGNKKLSFWQGDRKPYALFKGEKQIAGAVKKMLSGESVKFSSPYKAPFPKVEVDGMAFQGFKTGKNLLDFKKFNTNNGSDYNKIEYLSNGVIASNSIAGYPTFYIDIPNVYGDFTISFDYKKLGDKPISQVDVRDYKKGTPTHAVIRMKENEIEGHKEYTLTNFPKESGGIRMYFYINSSGTTCNASIQYTNIQLEEGTSATPYEPYWAIGDKPQYSGKNQINLLDYEFSYLSTKAEIKENNIKIMPLNNEGNNWYDCYIYLENLKPNTNYTFSYKIKGFNNQQLKPQVLIDSKTFSKRTEDGTPITFNTELNEKIRIIFYLTLEKKPNYINLNDYIEYTNIQLEEGSTPTEYEPYCGGSPTPNPYYPIEPVFNKGSKLEVSNPPQVVDVPILRAIPNTEYKDTYNPQTQTITRRIGELVSNGTEDWVTTGVDNKYTRGYALNSHSYNTKLKDIKILSNSLIGSFEKGEQTVLNSCSQTDATYGLRIAIDRKLVPNGTLEELKILLKEKADANKPIKLWYVLETPIVEKVSTPPLIQDWSGELKATWGDCGIPEVRAEVWEEYDK